MQVEGLMMAIAPLVPHYLMGIAAGAGLLGFFMLCCGYFQPLGQVSTLTISGLGFGGVHKLGVVFLL